MDTEKTIGNDGSKVYEVGYIIVPSVPEEKVQSHVDALKALLAKNKAEIIADENPTLRPLAYRMQKKIGATNHKFDQGYFGWIKFELDKGSIEKIKVALDTDEAILRHLLITTVAENTYLGKSSLLIKEEGAAEKTPDAVIAEGEVSVAEVTPEVVK
ncbi:MAG: 30S ribosomal protein S6 [Candidatus Taylorbacteria bacterium]|nr:30S ribosomal protein S6 [Candidatus Taylorbacteria bacterium]